MTYDELLTLPIKTLLARGQELESERNRLDKWISFAAKEDGKWLIAELQETLDSILAYYGSLPINSPHAAAMLAGNQGRENEVRRFIRKLADSQNLRKEIDTEIEMVLNIVNQRRDADSEPGSFVPASHKPKQEDFDA